MGTVRFLLLWGCLALLLSVMVSAHSQHREGDNLDSVRRQNSKNGRHTNRRNENKEVTRHTGAFSAERDRTKLWKPHPGYLTPVSVLDTSNILDLSRTSMEKGGRRKRQSNGKKNGKTKKPCPGCYSPMGRPQRQKRKSRNKDVTNNPPEMCQGCFHPLGRSLKPKDLEEHEPSKKMGHKRPKNKGPPSRGLARSRKHDKEDSKGSRKKKGRGEHHPGSLSGFEIEDKPRRHHGHHKKEKYGKHRKNHHHEHSDGKDEKEE